jgi:hypothetical protein
MVVVVRLRFADVSRHGDGMILAEDTKDERQFEVDQSYNY